MLWRHDNPSAERGENSFVAVEDGSVVGFVRSVLLADDAVPVRGMSVLTTVDDSHRDTDLAYRLLDVSENDLVSQGAEVLRTSASEEAVQAGGEALRQTVLDRGYTLEETHHILGLELGSLPDVPAAPPGVELRPFSDYADAPARSTRSTDSPLWTSRVATPGSRPTRSGGPRCGGTRSPPWTCAFSYWSGERPRPSPAMPPTAPAWSRP